MRAKRIPAWWNGWWTSDNGEGGRGEGGQGERGSGGGDSLFMVGDVAALHCRVCLCVSPSKPEYSMAPPEPLVLMRCDYDKVRPRHMIGVDINLGI